ncbi:VrrA/YqfQ family protein [Bacillus sp. DTU_2020_1000418_1_SI_GHA_SEK_038]|uniref:VrrA/YqfQ family protein n=1 Tax=Bacillus sp. DTU_2020_1000418_1_SI_GHA_SEK_038 TaxID=3077585 RepID=UPI0028E97DB5|nr:VrrA/YqfQ family protein [Bacillus sp. DTU_2020_1000418_1_SI_GHA_SEK_038]WNS74323.1 VrrA/YqfQ family protein [Bacillus sp. DTU_2020_1000418_1_SI_GHA_SEK_038]
MIHGPRAPFHGGFHRHPYRNQMPSRPPMGPSPFSPMSGGGFRGPVGPSQMRRGGGGLLSKLLGRGNPPRSQTHGLGAAPLQSASRAAGAGGNGAGGILKNLSNPGAITGFLENTQKVLNTAQQFGPMIQQYGPIVKNIPAMWKLYRGLKNSTDETEENVHDNKEPVKTKKARNQANKTDVQSEQSSIQSEKNREIGTSKPKLYV